MSKDEINCEVVDAGDLDTRYLAGRLNPEEAEAFEAHFFGCERCWELVQGGLAVRSAFGADPPVSQTPPADHISHRSRSGWWALAAAAAVAVIGLGTWRTSQRSGPGDGDVLRGGETPFAVMASGGNTTLMAAWPRLPNADLYQVRLYTADGTLLVQRELVDTSIALPKDSIPLPHQDPAFWEVQALDHLRRPVARSDLTNAVISDVRP